MWLVFLMLQVWLVPPTSVLRLLRSDASAPPGAEPSRRPGPEARVQCHDVDPILEGSRQGSTLCRETRRPSRMFGMGWVSYRPSFPYGWTPPSSTATPPRDPSGDKQHRFVPRRACTYLRAYPPLSKRVLQWERGEKGERSLTKGSPPPPQPPSPHLECCDGEGRRGFVEGTPPPPPPPPHQEGAMWETKEH